MPRNVSTAPRSAFVWLLGVANGQLIDRRLEPFHVASECQRESVRIFTCGGEFEPCLVADGGVVRLAHTADFRPKPINRLVRLTMKPDYLVVQLGGRRHDSTKGHTIALSSLDDALNRSK